jgi:hypothetical protein
MGGESEVELLVCAECGKDCDWIDGDNDLCCSCNDSEKNHMCPTCTGDYVVWLEYAYGDPR